MPTDLRANGIRIVPTICGWLPIFIGCGVMMGWSTHWGFLDHCFPQLLPIKFNAALCFILSGFALILLTKFKEKIAASLGAVIAVFSFITLSQYVSGIETGLDHLFFRSYVHGADPFPDRMAPLTASCFTLLGAAFALTAMGNKSRPRLTMIGMLSCVVSMNSLVAMFGYAFGIESATGWGAYTRMSLYTAATFLIVCLGLLIWALREAQRIQFNFLRWLPMTGSMTLMVMIAFVTAISFSQLKKSTDSQKQISHILTTAQTFLSDVFDTSRGMRGYVLTGQTSSLDDYHSGEKDAPLQLSLLQSLMVDNRHQQDRLQVLTSDFDELITYSEQLIALRETKGVQASIRVDSTGQGFAIVHKTLIDLHLLTDEEQALLNQRSTAADANFRNTGRLLIFGSLLALGLLLISVLMAILESARRRLAESELQSVASFQRAILNSANYAIISADLQGIVTSFNETAERWLGYTFAEVVGKVTPALWHDAEEVAQRSQVLSRELGRTIEPGIDVFTAKVGLEKTDESEWTFIRKDGSRFPVSLSLSVLTDTSGKVEGYLGFISDISARKAMELELAKNRLRFEKILNNSLDAIIAWEAIRDASGKIQDLLLTLVNPSAERLARMPTEKLVGSKMLEVFPGMIRDGLFDKFVQIIETGKGLEFEYLATQTDPPRWYRIAGTKLGDGLSISCTEITVRKAMERALHEKNLELESAAHAKNSFLANMSHELRTPLNGIIGFSEILADGLPGPVNADQKEYLGDILNSGQHLLQLINDVLDLAKVEAGKMEVHPAFFSIGKAIEQVCSVAYPLVQKKKIQLTTTIAPGLDQVKLDQQKLKQVLYNLLSNAVKFTDENGKVEITAILEDENHFSLAVRDTGIGIKPENIKRLFKEFEQLDAGTTRRYEGTGLGLALTRKIVEIQGGKIKVESQFGQGTTFTVTLPLTIAEVA